MPTSTEVALDICSLFDVANEFYCCCQKALVYSNISHIATSLSVAMGIKGLAKLLSDEAPDVSNARILVILPPGQQCLTSSI